MLHFNPNFQVARLPAIEFGRGRITRLPEIIDRYGKRALLVTGRHSFQSTPTWFQLNKALHERGIAWRPVMVDDEPSPELVDEAVEEHRKHDIEVVVGIGGGSVLDAAKAIAGLLRTGTSVMDHLEGVGRGLPYPGPAVPFIAVPTTAGTGSEATKNAVLSRRGPDGFKKSFRDEKLVARVALVDPELLATCTQGLIAANGMDAFTQLLESWVSLGASPFTDALASSGMQAFRDGFWDVWENNENAPAGRTRLAWASLASGITLAQCGLGSVHGLASPLGAYFPIPHGVVCGTLVAEATRMNIRAMREREPDNIALQRYAEAGIMLTGTLYRSEAKAQDGLVSLLREWTERLQLPRLSYFGMTDADIPRVVANSRGGSMQTNPIALSDDELAEVLRARL
ncbi:MAG: iron-containing alcohol dehydrogenase [Gammaproteobacteria bacterium]|nr:MAG: iron-containing alcohol dehydrogenase [Gammaproteobacteria bacterium]